MMFRRSRFSMPSTISVDVNDKPNHTGVVSGDRSREYFMAISAQRSKIKQSYP